MDEKIAQLKKEIFTRTLSKEEMDLLTKEGDMNDWIADLLGNPYITNIVQFLAAFTFNPQIKKLVDVITETIEDLKKKKNKKKKSSLILNSIKAEIPDYGINKNTELNYEKLSKKSKSKKKVNSPIKSDLLLKDYQKEIDKISTIEDESYKLSDKINEIANKYGVEVISVVGNIQGTFDVELSENIYYKEQENMENEIRALGNINDISYKDIAYTKIAEEVKSDEDIANEFKDFKIKKITMNPGSNSSGIIEIEFPNAGESVAGGQSNVLDHFIFYDDGKIAFDNWYPEDVYMYLIKEIKNLKRSNTLRVTKIAEKSQPEEKEEYMTVEQEYKEYKKEMLAKNKKPKSFKEWSKELKNVKTAALEKWKYPKDYMGEDYSDYYIVATRSRDSEALTESNFDEALKMLGGESDNVIVARFGHWASGWIEQILVNQNAKDKVAIAEQIQKQLAEYPVLNEEDLSEREMKQYTEDYDNWAKEQALELLGLTADDIKDEAKFKDMVIDNLSANGGDLYDKMLERDYKEIFKEQPDPNQLELPLKNKTAKIKEMHLFDNGSGYGILEGSDEEIANDLMAMFGIDDANVDEAEEFLTKFASIAGKIRQMKKDLEAEDDPVKIINILKAIEDLEKYNKKKKTKTEPEIAEPIKEEIKEQTTEEPQEEIENVSK